MPKFAITYHLNGSEMTPSELIEAESIQQAAKIAGLKFGTDDPNGAIVVPYDQDMYAIPKQSVAYCHIRTVIERRRSSGINYDELDAELPAAEPA
jgi:hypothetical protein